MYRRYALRANRMDHSQSQKSVDDAEDNPILANVLERNIRMITKKREDVYSLISPVINLQIEVDLFARKSKKRPTSLRLKSILPSSPPSPIPFFHFQYPPSTSRALGIVHFFSQANLRCYAFPQGLEGESSVDLYCLGHNTLNDSTQRILHSLR